MLDIVTQLTTNIFKFERRRLGNKKSNNGVKYGPYLYRNTITNELIASWDAPKNDFYLHKGEDIGFNTDALIYYKNY